MKILFVTTRFYPHVGGVEEVVENISSNLGDKHEVVVLSSINEWKNPLTTSTETEDYKGIKVKRVWMNLPGYFSGKFEKDKNANSLSLRTVVSFLAFPYRLVSGVYKMNKFIKEFNPDVINLHFPDDAAIYFYLATIFIKKSIVTNIHGNDLQVISNIWPYSFFTRMIIKKSSKIVVNSEYMSNEFGTKYPHFLDKVLIIPNGLDINFPKSISPSRFFDTEYIFYVGRIVNKKGVDIMLKAFAKAGISNLKLLVEGKGELLSDMKSLAQNLGIQDKVSFTNGKLSKEDKYAYMKGSLFGIIPSRIEPFGIVALEFLASGTPLVASHTGGLVTILKDGETALFFENGNVEDLADKIHTLSSEQSLRDKLSQNGIIEATNYGWGNISQKYSNLFTEVIKNYE